jgi:hypothetical protein
MFDYKESTMRLASILVLFFSLNTFAAPLPELLEDLRDSGVNYEIVGTVCEQVARLELQKQYPPQNFEIINGIEYGDNDGVIGELDVVVFEKATKKAVLVGEVKCWRDLRSALSKAKEQRRRFVLNLSRKIELHDYESSFDKSQFDHIQKYVAIAPKGSDAYGFEMAMENSMEELMKLRQMLMECQDRGQCKAADHNH